MSIADLLVLLLAGWRISNLLSDIDEGGPWGIFYTIRHKLGVAYDPAGEMVGTNIISRMIVCYYCNSFWIGILIAAMYLLIGSTATLLLMLPFAISGAVIFMAHHLEG